MDCSPPVSLVHGFLHERYWSGLSFPFPGDLPDPGIKTGSATLQAGSLPSEPPGKPTKCSGLKEHLWLFHGFTSQKSGHLAGFSPQSLSRLKFSYWQECISFLSLSGWIHFQSDSGFWPDSVPCDYRTEIFIPLLVVGWAGARWGSCLKFRATHSLCLWPTSPAKPASMTCVHLMLWISLAFSSAASLSF